MKKLLKNVLFLGMATLMAFATVACGAPDSGNEDGGGVQRPSSSEKPTHKCNFEEWSYDSYHHWKECVSDKCDLTEGYGEHSLVDGVCSVCGLGALPYVMKVPNGQTIAIDGVIDEAWGGYTFIMQKEIDGKEMSVAPAEAMVMWDEGGLYFLAKIYDNTIVDKDRMEFWVSETYKTGSMTIPYSEDPGLGEYALAISVNNKFDYKGYNAENECVFAVSTHADEGYFIVEAYMPKMTNGTYKQGHAIGLEMCTNHYDRGTSRLFCVPWNKIGRYWETPTALNQVVLLDLN